MRDIRLTVSEPLLEEAVPHNARCGRIVFRFLFLLSSLSLGVLLILASCSHDRGGQQLAAPMIAMANRFQSLPTGNQLQPLPSAVKRFQPHPILSNRFQAGPNSFSMIPYRPNSFQVRSTSSFASANSVDVLSDYRPQYNRRNFWERIVNLVSGAAGGVLLGAHFLHHGVIEGVTLGMAGGLVGGVVGNKQFQRFSPSPNRTADKIIYDAKKAALNAKIDALQSISLFSKLLKLVYWRWLLQHLIDFFLHTAAGFKLLWADTRITSRLMIQQLRGEELSRRERQQMVRTTADLFRLVPFSAFLIIPGMELLLPFAMKIFPGLLPTQFQNAQTEQAKKMAALKVKVDMAKFLVETLDEMATARKEKAAAQDGRPTLREFTQMLRDNREAGYYVNTQELRRYSQVFKDEVTLEKLKRPQIKAICRVLQVTSVGTDDFLRWRIRMELRKLHADDVLISKEGVESLTDQELRTACRQRGMRVRAISEAGLRRRLKQWIDLHVVDQVPELMLIMSRTLFLTDPSKKQDLKPEEQLIAALDSLPDEVKDERPMPSSAEDKLLLLKEEEALIAKERKEAAEERAKIEETTQEIGVWAKITKKMQKAVNRTEDEEPVAVLHSDTMQPLNKTKAAQPVAEDTEEKKLVSVLAAAAQNDIDLAEAKSLEGRVEELREELREELEAEPELNRKKKEKEVKGESRADNAVLRLISHLEKEEAALLNSSAAIAADVGDAHGVTVERLDGDGDGFITTNDLIMTLKALSGDEDEILKKKIKNFASKFDVDKDGVIDYGLLKKAIADLAGEGVGINDESIEAVVKTIIKESQVEEREIEDSKLSTDAPALTSSGKAN